MQSKGIAISDKNWSYCIIATIVSKELLFLFDKSKRHLQFGANLSQLYDKQVIKLTNHLETGVIFLFFCG